MTFAVISTPFNSLRLSGANTNALSKLSDVCARYEAIRHKHRAIVFKPWVSSIRRQIGLKYQVSLDKNIWLKMWADNCQCVKHSKRPLIDLPRNIWMSFHLNTHSLSHGNYMLITCRLYMQIAVKVNSDFLESEILSPTYFHEWNRLFLLEKSIQSCFWDLFRHIVCMDGFLQ